MVDKIRTYVHGFDEKLDGGIPQGHVVLISGTTGTMKSSLAFSILYYNGLYNSRKGLYITVDVSAQDLIEQMVALGICRTHRDKHDLWFAKVGRNLVSVDKCLIFDITNIRTRVEELGVEKRLLEVFEDNVSALHQDYGFEILVLDTLNLLLALAQVENRREAVFKFFRWIRDLGITTLAVTESYPSGAWHVYDHASLPSSFAAQLSILYHGHDDSFLADGLIKLSMQEAGAGIQRRIQCIKMRGVNHDLEEFALGIKDGRFNITEVL